MPSYAIFDNKISKYMFPFPSENDLTAVRSVIRTAHADENFGLFADDYILFRIGDWDEDQALLVPEDMHLNLGSVAQILASHRMEANRGFLDQVEAATTEEQK